MRTTTSALLLLLAIAATSTAMDAPELITPAPGQHYIPTQGTLFTWQPKAGYDTWILQVADNQGLAHPFVDAEVHAPSLRCTTPLPADAHLYWRILYVNDEGQISWSGTGHFWTAPSLQRRHSLIGD
jgi:hypothetical protein